MLAQIGKAGFVQSVSAGRKPDHLTPRVEQALQANRTVVFECVWSALVLKVFAHTAVARLAVFEIVTTAGSADAALITMEMLLCIIVVEQGALWAKVLGKLLATLAAGLTHGLNKLAGCALEPSDLEAVEVVSLFGIELAAVVG